MMNLAEKIGDNLKGTVNKVKEMESNIGTYRMVSISEIQYNPKNRRKYSNSQVEELANSIHDTGLQQNIVVLQLSDNVYRLIAGEKRTRAYKYLKFQGYEGYDNIYAKIYKNLDEVQEELILLQTNQLATVDSLEERAEVAKRINELADTLIQQGRRFGSRREISKELSGKSGKQIERDLKLGKLIPELLKLAEEKNLAQSGIIECSTLSKDEQLKVYNALKEMIDSGSKPNRSEIIEITKQHKEEIKRLQEENKDIRKQNQSLLKDKQSLEEKLGNMQKEINSLSREKGKLKKDLMEKDSNIENIIKSLEIEKNKNSPDRKHIEKLQEELNTAKNQRNNLSKELEQKDLDMKYIEEKLHETSERANSVDNPMPRVQENIELGFMLQSLENTFNDVIKKYETMNTNKQIGVSELNQTRLMNLIEKIIATVQK